jgi:HEAT repeat protein
MQSLSVVRDDRATPLLAYILRNISHKGTTAPVYLRAIESLGAQRDPEAIAPLKEVLYRGEWWAPRRTASLRAAAAGALARMGTPEAFDALEEAVTIGSRGVRSAARQHVEARARRTAPDRPDGEEA